MRCSHLSWIALCLWLACACVVVPGVGALKTDFTLQHDARAAFHVSSFGFEQGGIFHLELQNMNLRLPIGAPQRDGYDVAFVLGWSNSDQPVLLTGEDSTNGPTGAYLATLPAAPPAAEGAPADPPATTPLLDKCFHRALPEGVGSAESPAIIRKLDKANAWEHLVYERIIDKPGFWHLYYSNCEPRSSVDLHVELTQYNLNHDGSRCYLSAGERFLPALMAVLAFLFTALAIAWAVYLRMRRQHVRAIHWLMLLVVVVKALSLGVDSQRYHVLKAEGVPDAFTGVSYVVQGLRGLLLFSVIVLLGTGWSFVKSFLSERDKTLLLITITIQSLVNIAAVVVGETSQATAGWANWHDVLGLLDLACWAVILMPLAWSIRSLRSQALDDARRGERAARNLLRLQSFRQFCLIIVAFVYTTRFVVFLLAGVLNFEQAWIAPLVGQVATFTFYFLTGILFRPQGHNPYLPLSSAAGMDEAAEMAQLGFPHSGLGGEENDLDEEQHRAAPRGLRVDQHTRDARDNEQDEQMEFDAQLDELEAHEQQQEEGYPRSSGRGSTAMAATSPGGKHNIVYKYGDTV